MARIHLSPPDVTSIERDLLIAAFDAKWVAPAGPDLKKFEEEVCARVGVPHGVALNSGTAALHLALLLVGVEPGDEVVIPSLTFAACANAVGYAGARPVFVDSEQATWNLDPQLLDDELITAEREGRHVAAVMSVDLFGQCADYDPIRQSCIDHGVPLIEDAAEAIGATWQGRPAGSFGDFGVFSFNGNKALTTGGGGMLVGPHPDLIDRALHLATQAREQSLHYEHREVGYNYRLSNLLAAVGRGQLRRLDEMLARRRAIHDRYESELAVLPGVAMAPVDPRGEPNHWLSVVTIEPAEGMCDPMAVISALEAVDAEARPAWKPMHLQPVWKNERMVGGSVSERIFHTGVCLPSGSSLSEDEQDRVIEAARGVLGGR